MLLLFQLRALASIIFWVLRVQVRQECEMYLVFSILQILSSAQNISLGRVILGIIWEAGTWYIHHPNGSLVGEKNVHVKSREQGPSQSFNLVLNTRGGGE